MAGLGVGLPSRFVSWLAVLAVADVIAFALTIHAQVTYHPAPGDPSVTTLGQVLGWIISFGLLITIAVMILLRRYDRRMRGGK
jgi:hypothetical protein